MSPVLKQEISSEYTKATDGPAMMPSSGVSWNALAVRQVTAVSPRVTMPSHLGVFSWPRSLIELRTPLTICRMPVASW